MRVFIYIYRISYSMYAIYYNIYMNKKLYMVKNVK